MEYTGKTFSVTGRVESVINDGYAKRTVFLDNGRSFRIIKSQIAYAIENTEYRENVHTFYITHSGIYRSHTAYAIENTEYRENVHTFYITHSGIYLSHTHESCGEE